MHTLVINSILQYLFQTIISYQVLTVIVMIQYAIKLRVFFLLSTLVNFGTMNIVEPG